MKESGLTNPLPPPPVRSSKYAPLAPDGPLPPAVREDTVADAYRKMDLKPKRVLFSLGISRFGGTASQRLRQAVDRASSRKGRDTGGDNRRPVFHNALFNYLCVEPFAKEVHQKLIAPALLKKEGFTFLDPIKFSELIEVEKNNQREPVLAVTPSTDMEALALFALAFGLLQPKEAPLIVSAVATLGSGLQDFFGLLDDDASSEVRSRDDVSEQATAPIEKTSQITRRTEDSIDTSSTSELAEATSTTEEQHGDALDSNGEPLGWRRQSLSIATDNLERKRRKRIGIGAATAFDRSTFDAAFSEEEAALRELDDINSKLKPKLNDSPLVLRSP